MASTQTNKILVLGPAWIGDMVMAQSLFKTLKLQQPNCEITVAAPPWTLPLLDRMEEVSEKIALPFKHGELAFWERIRFGKSLKTKGYQQAIILTNSLKSALLPWAAGIPKRTSFLGEIRYGLINDILPLDKKVLKKTVERFVALGLAKGQPLPADLPQPKLISDTANGEACLKHFAIQKTQQPIIGLCPGAEYGEAKRWPAEYYAEVANHMLKQGWQVMLFGSEKDKSVTNQINQLTQSLCIDLGGKTKLGDAIDLMAMCNTIVSNDSGLMHVAAALDKNLIAIFGSSDPLHTPPMNPTTVIEYLGLECSPCFKRKCPLGHLDCLKKINPIDIIQRIQ
jgi:heptosyltransferase-2